MNDEMTEWKCSKCPFTVWRYTLRSEARETTIPFPHSRIHHDGDDPPCIGRLVRTGRTRNGYVDEVYSPSRMVNQFPRWQLHELTR